MNPTQVWIASSVIGVIIHVAIGFANWQRIKLARQWRRDSETAEELSHARGVLAVARLNLDRDFVLLLIQAIFLVLGLSAIFPFLSGGAVVWGLVLGQVLLVMNSLIGFYRQGQIAKGKV